jgi:hypothetical protein
VDRDDPPPAEALDRAVAACQQALVDYQSGLLDEDQLRRALYHGGIVLGDREAWLLDLAGGGWRRYDGIGTHPYPPAPDDGDVGFDAATLRRWQAGLRDLMAGKA